MLAEQARCAAQLFTGEVIPAIRTQEAYRTLRARMENRILVGMPGRGKSTVGRALAAQLDRPFVDTDAELEKVLHMPVGEYITHYGEEAFRKEETALLAQLGKSSGLVIATGGAASPGRRTTPTSTKTAPFSSWSGPCPSCRRRGAPLPEGGAWRTCTPSACLCTAALRTSPWPTTARPRRWPRSWREAYEHFSD